jgi:hypothetical protein
LLFYWAAESNHVDTARALADASLPTVFAVDERDRTPLQVAEKELAFEAISALAAAEETPMVLLRVAVEEAIAQPLGGRRPPPAPPGAPRRIADASGKAAAAAAYS